MTKRNHLFIMMGSTLVCAITMSFVDGVIQPAYAVKSLIKLLLFSAVPIVCLLRQGQFWTTLKKLFVPNGKTILIALSLGIGVYGILIGGYFLFNAVYDITDIVIEATSKNGVHADNFLWVSLYISFINSLLEEFLFRGFAFLSLKQYTSRRTAYLFSAAVFALYHLGMIAAGMNVIISVLGMIGLFVAGIVLSFLNEKSNSILTSWLVHMFANFAINTVGFFILHT